MPERMPDRHVGPAHHPLHRLVVDELHARPFESVALPARVVSFTLMTRSVPRDDQIAHLNRLCAQHGLPAIPADRNHLQVRCADFALTWARHAEFSSYTFFLHGARDGGFVPSPYQLLPAAWCAEMKGELIGAIDLTGLDQEAPFPDVGRLADLFDRPVIGGLAIGGKAQYWTDFFPDASGFVRVLVKDIDLSDNQAGRLLRRLADLQSYCLMALLALPVARQITPDLTACEAALGEIVAAQGQADDVDQERGLLARITELAARVEHLAAVATGRFDAAQASSKQVARLLRELREVRVEGIQPLCEFMERRLDPAMRTCDATHRRLNGLAKRIARASELLRTRVDVTLAAQNRDLLMTMNRRARAQMRMQQSVEGLSIAAITYYASGILGHFTDGLERLGLHLPGAAISGLSVPVIAVLAWFALRNGHRLLAKLETDPEH